MPLLSDVENVDLTEEMKIFQAQREETENARREAAVSRYKVAQRSAVASLIQTGIDIASREEDPVTATDMAAEFYEVVTDQLTNGAGNSIAERFVAHYQTDASQAQVQELQGRVLEAQRELDNTREGQEELERSAQRAANLEVQRDEARREVQRLKQELDNATNTTTSQSDQISTLVADNSRLEQEKSELQGQLEAAGTTINSLTNDNNRLDRDKIRLKNEKTDIQTQLDEALAATQAAETKYNELRQRITQSVDDAQALLNEPDDLAPASEPTSVVSGADSPQSSIVPGMQAPPAKPQKKSRSQRDRNAHQRSRHPSA